MSKEIKPVNHFVHLINSIVDKASNCSIKYEEIINLQRNLFTSQINLANKITEFNEIDKIDIHIIEGISTLNKQITRIQNKSLDLDRYDIRNNHLSIEAQNTLTSLDNSCKNLSNYIEDLYTKLSHLSSIYNEVTVSARVSRGDENGIRFELLKEVTNLISKKNSLLHYLTNVIGLADNSLSLINDAATLVNENIIKEHLIKNSFAELLNEEKARLIKQFNNELSIIQERYEMALKSYDSDSKRVQKSANLLATAVEAGLKTANELNEKTQHLELDFSTIINEKKLKIDQELEIERKKISTNIKDAKDALFAEEKTIRDAHKDFLTLVGNAGIYKLTENYNEKAKDEKKEYKRFRRYTAYSLIAAIVSTFFIFIWALFDKPDTTYDFMGYLSQHESSNKIDYFLLLSRLSISLMFFVLAYYLSKQASKHYECYQENHRTFLQLAALEPFMVKMNEDEQKIIRKGLIPTYFNQNADGKFAPAGDEIGFPSSITSPIEKLAEVLKPIIDKAVDKGGDAAK